MAEWEKFAEYLADYMATRRILAYDPTDIGMVRLGMPPPRAQRGPWVDTPEAAMRETVHETCRLIFTEALPDTLRIVRAMRAGEEEG